MKKHAAFKWKDTISGFHVSPGSAEAPVKWGGKTKHVLIAYFLGNICAKNCRNRTVYVKSKSKVGVVGRFFSDTAYMMKSTPSYYPLCRCPYFYTYLSSLRAAVGLKIVFGGYFYI